MNVSDGTTTSPVSPQALAINCRAIVPLQTATQWRTPVIRQISASNSWTTGPLFVIQPLSRTAAI